MERAEHPLVQARQDLHEAVAAAVKLQPDTSEGYVTGWVLLVETEDPSPADTGLSTSRGMTLFSSDATGDQDLAPHTAMGWILYAGGREELFFDFDQDDDEDDPVD